MKTTLEILYTRHEVADALGIHVNTVDRLVARGELKATRIGRAVRFRPTDVYVYVDAVTSGVQQ